MLCPIRRPRATHQRNADDTTHKELAHLFPGYELEVAAASIPGLRRRRVGEVVSPMTGDVFDYLTPWTFIRHHWVTAGYSGRTRILPRWRHVQNQLERANFVVGRTTENTVVFSLPLAMVYCGRHSLVLLCPSEKPRDYSPRAAAAVETRRIGAIHVQIHVQ